ncbi:hypothetical protein NMY22_g15149 [Coprinellus aureogranulatus]|nr:hypothetical protein NMY22_g15149 [Coprinellus aureogranulatus]
MVPTPLSRNDGALNVPVKGRNIAPFPTAAPPTGPKLEVPLRSPETRICAALNCVYILPMDYPHLRCRTCRALNIPRKPELQTILTPAQLLARERKYQAVPPLPSRVGQGPHIPVGRVTRPLQPHYPPPQSHYPARASHYPPAPYPAPPPLPFRARPPPLEITPVQTVIVPADPSPFVPAPPPVTCKVEPDIDADIALQALLKPSSDDDSGGDTDTIDLTYPDELSYPESGNATPIDVKPPLLPSGSSNVEAISLSASTSTQPASKRRKVSHTEPGHSLPEPNNGTEAAAVPQLPAPPLPYNPKAKPPLPVPPLPTRRPLQPRPNATASSSNAKPCSEPDCQNHIPAASPATRCMSCISKAWKSKRSGSQLLPAQDQDGGRSSKKGVKWADRGDREEEHDEFNFRKVIQNHEDEAKSTEAQTSDGPTKGEEKAIEGWDSDLTELTQSDSERESSGEEDGYDSGNEVSESDEQETPATPVRTGLKIRIPPRSVTKAEASSPVIERNPSRESSLESPLASRSADAPQLASSPTPDRDTSSLAHSTPKTTPDLEPELTQEADKDVDPVRLCAHARCKQTLPAEYHWKTCVVCRARARGYQRERQNLQGRHMQLDQELEEYLKTHGVPDEDPDATPPPLQTRVKLLLSGPKPKTDLKTKPPPVKVDIEPFDDDDGSYNLIPGARTCSSKDCSFVVPPTDEYPFKLCGRCRARSKDNSRPGRKKSSNGVPKNGYRHEFAGPEALAMKREDGRCLTSDCGMLVSAESKYPYCRQCRIQDWRLKRRNLRKVAILELERSKSSSSSSSGSSTPLSIKIPALRNRVTVPRPVVPPRPPTPYPEYKNLAALLTNFRKLAKNFFDAQTMHFAHQSPESAASLSIFIFDGEFSLVAPDLYVAQKRKAQVEKMVGFIQREVAAAARVQYAEKKWLTMFNSGIVTRFVCWREPVNVCVPVPIVMGNENTASEGRGTRSDKGKGKAVAEEKEKTPTQPEPQRYRLKEVLSYHRIMEGELEIAVFADKSHPFIPGERTVVRMRLVG